MSEAPLPRAARRIPPWPVRPSPPVANQKPAPRGRRPRQHPHGLANPPGGFAGTPQKVRVRTVESGFTTKDFALLIGPDQPWLSITGFLDKVDENLQKAMA